MVRRAFQSSLHVSLSGKTVHLGNLFLYPQRAGIGLVGNGAWALAKPSWRSASTVSPAGSARLHRIFSILYLFGAFRLHPLEKCNDTLVATGRVMRRRRMDPFGSRPTHATEGPLAYRRMEPCLRPSLGVLVM